MVSEGCEGLVYAVMKDVNYGKNWIDSKCYQKGTKANRKLTLSLKIIVSDRLFVLGTFEVIQIRRH